MKARSKAFSLIELMVVIAIVAILSALAVPAYKDNVIRATIAKAQPFGEYLTKQIMEYYDRTGNWPNADMLGIGSGWDVFFPSELQLYGLQMGHGGSNNTATVDCPGVNPLTQLVLAWSGTTLGVTFDSGSGGDYFWGDTNTLNQVIWVIPTSNGTTFKVECGYFGGTAEDISYLPENCQNIDMQTYVPTCS